MPSLTSFLYARIVVHRGYHLINFLINHASKEITEERKRFCVRMRNYWFLIAWLITSQTNVGGLRNFAGNWSKYGVCITQLKVVVRKIDRYIFCWVIQRSRMQRCIKEKSNVRRYYVDAKLEQWSVSLECFKYKTPYLLEALSARVAFKLFPWRVLPFLGYTTLESSTIGIVKGVYISNLHHSGEHEPLKIL